MVMLLAALILYSCLSAEGGRVASVLHQAQDAQFVHTASSVTLRKSTVFEHEDDSIFFWRPKDEGAKKCDQTDLDEMMELFGAAPGRFGLQHDLFHDRANGKSRKRVLMLYPDADHNAAFKINNHMCYRLVNWARIYEDVRLIHISTVVEASEVLNAYPDDSIHHLVVAGHGSPNSLQFGNCQSTTCCLQSYTPSSHDFWALASQKLTRGGRVFLDSCLNAKSEEGKHSHAEYVASLLPAHKVYGAMISFGKENLFITDFEKFEMVIRSNKDEHGRELESIRNFVKVMNCEVTPVNWTDEEGRNCDTYAYLGLCLKEGKIVPGTDGYTANQACCQCGGGVHAEPSRKCPDFAIEGPSGECVCKDTTHKCFKDGVMNGCGGKGHGRFPLSCPLGKCVCGPPAFCPLRSNSYLEKGRGRRAKNVCKCSENELCFEGDSPDCPDGSGKRIKNGFDPSCDSCQCRPSLQPPSMVRCANGVCTCVPTTSCWKGDRSGECPIDPDYASRLGQATHAGEVVVSQEGFTQNCEMCQCKAIPGMLSPLGDRCEDWCGRGEKPYCTLGHALYEECGGCQVCKALHDTDGGNASTPVKPKPSMPTTISRPAPIRPKPSSTTIAQPLPKPSRPTVTDEPEGKPQATTQDDSPSTVSASSSQVLQCKEYCIPVGGRAFNKQACEEGHYMFNDCAGCKECQTPGACAGFCVPTDGRAFNKKVCEPGHALFKSCGGCKKCES